MLFKEQCSLTGQNGAMHTTCMGVKTVSDLDEIEHLELMNGLIVTWPAPVQSRTLTATREASLATPTTLPTAVDPMWVPCPSQSVAFGLSDAKLGLQHEQAFSSTCMHAF